MGALIAFAAVLMLAAPARATTARAVGLDEHVAISTAVVEATVGDATVERAEGARPFTDTLVRVERVLHGDAPPVFRVRQMRGPHGGGQFVVVGDGELHPGERVVLFVKRDPDGRFYLTALAQSVYHVQGETDDAPAERDLQGLALLEPDPAGRWVRARPDAPLTVGELGAAVQAASRRLRR